MAAEIDRSSNPDGRLALAYSLVDERGRLIDSQIDREVKTPVSPETAIQKYTGFIFSDATGTHTLKIAVVDERGRRGSVEHSFRAALTQVGEIRATDLLIADERTTSRERRSRSWAANSRQAWSTATSSCTPTRQTC